MAANTKSHSSKVLRARVTSISVTGQQGDFGLVKKSKGVAVGGGGGGEGKGV